MSQTRSRTLVFALSVVAMAFVAGLVGCKRQQAQPAQEPAQQASTAPSSTPTPFDESLLAAFAPLPAVLESANNPLNEAKVTLGRMLYFETRLSKNHDLSCDSCHELKRFGVDGLPVSPGHRGQKGTRNSPTVYNAAGHFVQFWDGRSPDVEDQAKGPILNPVEMAMPSEKAVVAVLASIPEYVQAFREAFPEDKEPLSFDNVARAIGAFERRLVTPARWDKFLGGDRSALTEAEKQGFMAFVQAGCTACHAGAHLGAHMYQKLGLVKPWPESKDQGRFEVTKQEGDRMMFKVPTLRNVTKTGPYLHDGSEPSLLAIVKRMSEHQLGRQLDDASAQSIVLWLETLTGELPQALIEAPALPPSTKRTPKADPS